MVYHNHRSTSRISAPDYAQKIRSAVEKMVRKIAFIFVCILEKIGIGLGSDPPSVLYSEGSPNFQTILLSSLQNLIGLGIVLRRFLNGWLVYPP